MKKIQIDDIKEISLEILKYVKQVCEKNNIKYFLAGGTLLGAIRHKGYIPWDDDIDLYLLKPDYDRLLEIIKKEDKYRVFAPGYVDDTYYLFAKLVDKRTIMKEHDLYQLEGMGVSIDIFPLHSVPSTRKEQVKYIKKLKNYKLNHHATLGNFWYYAENKYKKIVKIILRFPRAMYSKYKGRDYWAKKINALINEYDVQTSEYIGNPFSPYGIKDLYPKKLFEDTVDVEFEGEKFKAPIGYDKYMKSVFGDYMKLPPENKRVPQHDFNAYWLDDKEK